MDFIEYLDNSCVEFNIAGEAKSDIITELVDLLDKGGKINDREAVLKSIFDREQQMSTGLQSGVAMPHGKTDTVDKMVVAVGLKKDGVDFDSLDGKPSKIFVMTVSSVLHANEHIEFLGEISRVLMRSSIRKALLKVRSKQEFIELMING